jgi:hypothetical protein
MSNLLIPFTSQQLRQLSVKNEVHRIYNLILNSASDSCESCYFEITNYRFVEVMKELRILFPDVTFIKDVVTHKLNSYRASWN